MLENNHKYLRVQNYGLATYLKMQGYDVQQEINSTGLCCIYVKIEYRELEKRKDEYFTSPYKDYDKAARDLRDQRNKICCPKY